MQQKAEGELVSVETIEQELTLLVRGAQKVHLRGGIERPPRARSEPSGPEERRRTVCVRFASPG
ncbi:hypothetical protein GCM10027078_29420 [Nocardioides flavus (ex Wang et al. 2016)]